MTLRQVLFPILIAEIALCGVLLASAQNASGIFQGVLNFTAGGLQSSAFRAADVNGDGKLDLIVVNQRQNATDVGSVAVMLGNGDGTFQLPVNYASGGYWAGAVAVADVNGDGKLDVVMTNWCSVATTGGIDMLNCSSNAGVLGVLLGNGDGTFQAEVSYSIGAFISSVAVADFNGDGIPDVLVSNGLLPGNGDGTFKGVVSVANGNFTTVADVNGDGKLDLVFAGGSSSVTVALGNGSGTFQIPVAYAFGGQFTKSVTVADVNGDGKPDLLVANGCADLACLSPVVGMVGVLLGNGDGTFQPGVTYDSGAYDANSIAVGDLNGDGKPDIVVGNLHDPGQGSNGVVSVLLGNDNGTFQTAVTYASSGSGAAAVSAVDVNGDGKLDVLAANGNDLVGVLLGNGTGTLLGPRIYSPPANSFNLTAMAAGDLNGDGRSDLVVINGLGTQQIGVLLSDADGTLQAAVSYSPGGLSPNGIAIADVNGDGKPDLLVADGCAAINCSTVGGVAAVLLGNGNGSFQVATTYPVGGTGIAIATGDVNGDSKPDLIVANGTGVVVLLGNGDGTFQAAVTFNTGGFSVGGVAVTDVNGDGKLDLLVANGCTNAPCSPSGGSVAVLLGNGDGTFRAATTYAVTGFPKGIAVGDLNGDGSLDVAVNGGTLQVLLGNGDGTFQAALTGVGSGVAGPVALADFNGDGKLDTIVFGSLRLGNDDGTFQGRLPLGLSTSAMAVGDFNGDGRPDVAAGGLGILLNVTKFETPSMTTLVSSLNPSAVNEMVTYTATVSGAGGTPTGSVTFSINLNKPVTVALTNGQATFNWTFARTGLRTVTARYKGDATYAASSLIVKQQVNPLSATQTMLASSMSTSAVGQMVTFTATVTGSGAPAPTGSVTFTISGNKPVVVPLSNGVAAFNWTFLHAGMRTVTASYSGDGANLPSTSAMLSETIAQQPTTTALMSSLNPSAVGQMVTFTATVTGQNGGTPTGTVTFNVNLNKPVAVALVNGTATYAIAFRLAGPRSVSVSYSGDANNLASTSTTVNQTITRQATTTMLISSLNPSAKGQMVTFTATVRGVNGVVPTGTVTFAINLNKPVVVNLVNDTATFNWTFAMSGVRTVTATYSGDANNQASASSVLTQTIN